jgi:allantoicase
MDGRLSVIILLMIGMFYAEREKVYNSNGCCTYDRCILKLGFAGSIHGFDIDTSFFTGNQAPAASVEATYAAEGQELKDCEWTQILPKVELPPSSHNIFELEKSTAVYTHLRLNNYPDGGIARFRVYGDVEASAPKDPK